MGSRETKTIFSCEKCGFETLGWLGRCPECGSWNSLQERRAHRKTASGGEGPRESAQRSADIGLRDFVRLHSGIPEFDGLLGGGLVPGSFVLIGGEPGIGKSTLMLQVAAGLAAHSQRVLYVSAEESLRQVGLRADRVGARSATLFFLCESDVSAIMEEARKVNASALVIDSVQTMCHPEVPGAAGSVNQVRESAAAFMRLAKIEGVTVFIVGHVTKSGAIAGPRMLEHMVDTVLYFEGDGHQAYRVLRTRKNRFGSTEEIGIFAMGAAGLEAVGDPSRFFLQERAVHNAGSVVAAAIEGTRPLLIEIQALVGADSGAVPQRRTVGLDYNRLCMLLAVLQRRNSMKLGGRDVFLNIAGGLAVTEPAVDLAVALAVVSSYAHRPVDADLVVLGEIGLGGELRRCTHTGKRLHEAAKLGFKRALLPRSGLSAEMEKSGLVLLPCGTLDEALRNAGLRDDTAGRRSSSNVGGRGGSAQ
jgi:DNA repair protein RadA/Sms